MMKSITHSDESRSSFVLLMLFCSVFIAYITLAVLWMTRCSDYLVCLFRCCDDSVDCVAVVDRDDTVKEENNFSHLYRNLIIMLGLLKLT
ncbi:hypothetical protein T10_9799 [Trichinella papuae]|uniref:Uncharacterized protein n=1 Tax=Trichinella papuae TaxID=268474 RepID=A0A0V1N6J4_9BILA|nr:hypothetical protein T10_9799 [Trichinella papuae]